MENSDSSYRSLCSTETLRSGKKGFFHDFSEHVMETVGDAWISLIFGKLKSDEDRIKTVFGDDKIKGVVIGILKKVSPLFRNKNAEVSRNRRLEAHQLATAGQREKALVLFSQAVLRAPRTGLCKNIDGGFSLALAYLGRAEVFMSLKEYDHALEDFQLAAEENLPNEFKQGLDENLKKCKRLLDENKNCIVPATFEHNNHTILPELSKDMSNDLPRASTLVEIQDTSFAGKRAIAAADINPGDTLVVEPPIASCILPDFYGTHCQQCFSRLRAPVGCPECSTIAFCSRKCRDIALSTYHKYECKILALLIGSGMSILSAVAFRMITQEGFLKCRKMYDMLNNENTENNDSTLVSTDTKLSKSAKRRLRKKKLEECKKSASGNRSDEDIDIRAYDLVMHETKRTPKDFLERTLMAAFLLKCLQRVNFFEEELKDDDALTSQEIAVGSLLLKNLQLLQFNAHEVFETRLGTDHRFRGSKPVYIGVAIYPTVARFNHDCYPAVTRYFVGRNIVIRATRCLKPGEVIAENYGPIFTKRNLADRRRTLEGRYWFRCMCKACLENWPLFEDMVDYPVRLKCPSENCTESHTCLRGSNKVMKCSTCGEKINLQDRLKLLRECEDLYTQGLDMMEKEKPATATEIFTKGMKIFHKIALPPHRHTHLAEIALAACMADSGSTWKAQII